MFLHTQIPARVSHARFQALNWRRKVHHDAPHRKVFVSVPGAGASLSSSLLYTNAPGKEEKPDSCYEVQ